MVHLKNGYVISIGRKKSNLLHIPTGSQTELSFRDLQSLQALALGHPVDDPTLLTRLSQEDLLVEGPATTDDILRERLRRFDHLYLASYQHTLSPRELRAYELILAAHARRKQFYMVLGQCPVLPETALRRALLVGDAEKVGVQRVVCVGDDDLVSIGLAALGHEVLSCDIDEYLLKFLGDTAKEFELSLSVRDLDLRDPVPLELRGAFDVFLTDPMSNRECFELFLSRGLEMLRPEGRGFCAVHGPTSAIFQEVAAEMKLPLVQWHRRHNRYYSHFMKLHRYESDWIELTKAPETCARHGADQFASPLQLYREDCYQRPITLLEFYDEIDDTRYAQPLYLEVLLGGLMDHMKLKEIDRHTHYAQDWTAIQVTTREGYLALHVDRRHRQITFNSYPLVIEVEEAARTLLMNAYKRKGSEAFSATSHELWDLRIR